jgi:hypothetical protein
MDKNYQEIIEAVCDKCRILRNCRVNELIFIDKFIVYRCKCLSCNSELLIDLKEDKLT